MTQAKGIKWAEYAGVYLDLKGILENTLGYPIDPDLRLTLETIAGRLREALENEGTTRNGFNGAMEANNAE